MDNVVTMPRRRLNRRPTVNRAQQAATEIHDMPEGRKHYRFDRVDGLGIDWVSLGLIFSTEFCQRMLPILEKKHVYIPTPHHKKIYYWVRDHYDEYKVAPGSSIDLIYKRELKTLGREEADLIYTLLKNVFENKKAHFEKDPIPVELLCKQTIDYLFEKEIDQVISKVQDFKDKGNIQNAVRLIQEYNPLVEISSLYIEDNLLISSTDFINEELPEPRILIHPWLIDGSITMIYAPRGIGKTWLALLVSVLITRERGVARTLGNWSVYNTGGVLYIDGEMGQWHIQERLKALCSLKEDDIHTLTLLSAARTAKLYNKQINISDSFWREWIYLFFKERPQYQLLVLDNIASLTPGVSENQKEEWDPINQWLIRLRHLGVAVIIVHHANKTGQQRGTSGREDALDCIIKLSHPPGYKEREAARFIITFEKARNIGPGKALESFCLRLNKREDGTLEFIAEAAPERGSDNREIVLALLIDGVLKQKDIALKLGISKGMVSKYKKEATSKGYLSKDGKATESGKRFIQESDIDLSEYYENSSSAAEQ